MCAIIANVRGMPNHNSRYNKEQRIRIKKSIKEHLPGTFTSEPGIDYPYGDEGVKKDLILKLNLK